MPTKVSIRELSVSAGATGILKGVSLDIPANQLLGVIGPAGSGKTTLLRVLNRMVDLEPALAVSGRVELDGTDILGRDQDVVELRQRVGMVFALPVPLPMSIYENVVYGARLAGVSGSAQLSALVERSLRDACIWDEVKDRLGSSAMRLSGGQQQRVCLARSLALRPEVILLDEPCSGLDPISTAKIEQALTELKQQYTIVLVTNNTKQAARVCDQTAFFLMGELVEMSATEALFTNPRDRRTSDYVTGRFG